MYEHEGILDTAKNLNNSIQRVYTKIVQYAKTKGQLVTCVVCSSKFYVPKRALDERKYCSKQCWGKVLARTQRTGEYIKCLTCSKYFYRIASNKIKKHCNVVCRKQYTKQRLFKHTCLTCYKEFYFWSPVRKYCSRKCFGKGRNRSLTTFCSSCYTIFKSQLARYKRSKRLFCSRVCKNAMQRNNKIKQLKADGIRIVKIKSSTQIVIKCSDCKKSFQTKFKKGSRKFCKRTCYANYIFGKTREIRICLVCKEKFLSLINKQQKYCSRICVSISTHRKKIQKYCLRCNQIFYVSICYQKQKYCSMYCARISRKGRKLKHTKQYLINKARQNRVTQHDSEKDRLNAAGLFKKLQHALSIVES